MRVHSVNVYVDSKEYITFRRKIYIYYRIDKFFKPSRIIKSMPFNFLFNL